MTEQTPAATFTADLAKANEWINGGIPDGTPVGETLVVIAGLVEELDRLAGAVPDTGHPGADDMWTAREVEIMTDSLRLTVRRTARMLLDALNEQERLEAALASAAPPGDTGQARELEHPAGCPSCSGMLTDRDCDDRRPARARADNEEFVLRPPVGWLNRVDEVLCHHGAANGHGSHVGEALGRLIRSWRGPRNDSDGDYGVEHWGPRATTEPSRDTEWRP